MSEHSLIATPETAPSPAPRPAGGQDIFEWLRASGGFDVARYTRLLGAASEFKEGDAAIGVAAADDAERARARTLLASTTIADLLAHPVHRDDISRLGDSAVDGTVQESIARWTMAQLKAFLLDSDEHDIRRIMPGLASDIIAHAVKLMSNAELIAVSRKVFNPLPGSTVGARGYLGARIQPNSPTDDPEDIRWQVFDAFAYAVGDVLVGTNPVSSDVASVTAVELALRDVVTTFGLEDTLPWCVLAHIDVQAAAEAAHPGCTAFWFQSLAAVDAAAATFDISADRMRAHARTRTGPFGLYFETGQGADATNGHDLGFDMVMHEARNYGFARALAREVAGARGGAPWVHVNDVAGFIGPEVFRTKEQLVRCCLEDTVMGKLHGLTIGLDICSTLHMDVDLDDLDWCIDQVMPANPAYLMALPTKNDPMLSYLTTAYQDHVRIREQHGYRVSDAMWCFFQELGVIDEHGAPTEHFGDPAWVYLQYCRRRGDARTDAEILADARAQVQRVRSRGVLLAEGHGAQQYDLEPSLERQVRHLYGDSRACLLAELPAGFEASIAGAVAVDTLSTDRDDYILHPPTGEALSADGAARIDELRSRLGDDVDVQLVVSDGLNALALTDDGHLEPFLDALRARLADAGLRVADAVVVVRHGRVRAGYRIGERLFRSAPDPARRRGVVHVIGERPGSGHHAFSAYITAPPAAVWTAGAVDHNITRVVSGIADTALPPARAAADVASILCALVGV
ncbi:MAG TPA: ethanolamine ammonia-lyase subunit EutB [Longimicrobiales bacterium]|nr:ethanolamine ammonia-lyase subunit EutB [Longimicrobiales bacterium]